MADLKVKIYKGERLTRTVTVPGQVLRIAASLVPRRAVEALRAEGVELEEIVRLSENPEARGRLVVVEDHEKDETIVIALE